MKFGELIAGIEKARGDKLPEYEYELMKKLWNACVDSVADEWPVIGDAIRRLKQTIPLKE